jgi:hypothetical protein
MTRSLAGPQNIFSVIINTILSKLMWQSINLKGCQDDTQMFPVPMKVGIIPTYVIICSSVKISAS